MIAVVSCVWQRPERLQYTLGELGRQSVPFHLFLINNNPKLGDQVDAAVQQVEYPVTVRHNVENRGPYARIELMHDLSGKYDWFMTLDDDALFTDSLLAQWWKHRDPKAVQGWQGFRFGRDYWHKERTQPGVPCHYLWGSNLFVPAGAVWHSRVLHLPPEYWQCDDLWLCYHANHTVGMTLRGQRVGINVVDDGKDTYHGQHETKKRFLEELRGRGWNV